MKTKKFKLKDFYKNYYSDLNQIFLCKNEEEIKFWIDGAKFWKGRIENGKNKTKR